MNDEEYLRQHLNQLEKGNKPEMNEKIPTPKKDNSRTVDLQYQATDVKELPCGIFYPTGTILMVRPALVKEIQAYSMVDDNNFPDIIDKMDDMLMSCVRLKYADGSMGTYLDIKEQDRLYIIFKIRELTFQQGMFLGIKKTCQCKNEIDIELRRHNFIYFKPSEKLMKFFDQEERCFVFEYKGSTFRLTMPNVGLQKSFTQYITEEVTQKKDPNLSFLKIMPFVLGDRNKMTIKEIKDEMIKFQSMSMDAFQFLNSAVEYMKFGIEKLMKICNVCSGEVLSEMIFPSGAKGIFLVSDAFASFIEQ